MKLPELYQSLQTALVAPLNIEDLARLTNHAKELAALTTRAPSIIDPTGQACAINLELEAQIKALFEIESSDALAALHDAVLDLRSAIIQHDQDLTPRKDSGPDDMDF